MMKKFVWLLAIFCCAILVAEAQDEYRTPPYGYFSLLSNMGKYKSQYGEMKTRLLYLDASGLALGEKNYLDWGLPVAGWLLSRAAVTTLSGSDEDMFDDEGEISYIYFKYGKSIIDLDIAKIGIGISSEIKGLNIEEGQLGSKPIGYITASPLLYSRIDIGGFAIVPVVEYNALNYTQMHYKSDKVKRTGYTITTHFVTTLSGDIGLNISPMYSVGNYKTSSVSDPNNVMFLPTDWKSTNFFIKVGLIKKI